MTPLENDITTTKNKQIKVEKIIIWTLNKRKKN